MVSGLMNVHTEVFKHARRSRSRHREHSNLTGWHQVSIKEPRMNSGALLHQYIFPADFYKIEVSRPGFEPEIPWFSVACSVFVTVPSCSEFPADQANARPDCSSLFATVRGGLVYRLVYTNFAEQATHSGFILAVYHR